jgi:type IV secretory pathway TrbD component
MMGGAVKGRQIAFRTALVAAILAISVLLWGTVHIGVVRGGIWIGTHEFQL